MTAVAEPPAIVPTVEARPKEGETEAEDFVGIVTRTVSWLLDAAVINLVSIIVGVGTALVLSIFPLGNNLKVPFEAIAGGVYLLWAAAYFVAFWSTTGQTPGARVMQIRLVTASGGRVKPARALVRWVGMNAAMLALFTGFIPILFRRRGFPDWLAKTLVVASPQMSIAEVGRASLRAARGGDQSSGQLPPFRRPE